MVDAGPLRSLSLLCSECAIYISKNKRGAVTELNDRSLSRRKCFGLAATASLGSGILVAERLSASIFQSPAGETNKNQQSENALGARTYNIRDFGAKGDGTTLDTSAVQAAIDAGNKDQGGPVWVPGGAFLIGTVGMRSNVRRTLAAPANRLGPAEWYTDAPPPATR